MPFDTAQLPKDLIESVKEGRAIFFVGSGLSVAAGLPTWSGLMDELIIKTEQLGYVSAEKIAEYKRLSKDPSKFLFLAEDLKAEMASGFTDYMYDRFGKPDIKPTETHLALMDIPHALVITLNYDRLLENAFNSKKGYPPNSYTYRDSREAANSYWKRSYFILKAHGDANRDVEGLILSQRDYRRTLYRENGYRSLLQAMFTTNAIIFLGVSLNDPEFNQLVDYLHDSYHGGGPTHFALLEETRIENTMAKRYFEDFKIQTVKYSNGDGTHQEVLEFLKCLSAAINP
jgi:hypothetical protein